MPVFPVACWMLGLMAFVQLLIAGMALATRLEQAREVRIVKQEVVKPVIVPLPQENPPLTPPPARRTPTVPAPVAEAPPIAGPAPALTAPQIADPRSERLFKEAREARLARGDMMAAIAKLQEALDQSPEEPALHYELGLVHEEMGVYDTAAGNYEKVFQMGTTGAGAFYQLAAAKLRDGFGRQEAPVGLMTLGRVRIFSNPNDARGELVVLTIPVQKAPGHETDVGEIAVKVEFFNRTEQGEIVPLEDNSRVSEKWVTLPFDWVGGEESLRMTYVIPNQDDPSADLTEKHSYYGQVVSLMYKGEVLDIQAWPRDLAARIVRQPAGGGNGSEQPPEFMDSLPPDFDPEVPLLPALPSNE